MPLTLQLANNWTHRHLAETDSTMLQLRRPEWAMQTTEFALLTTDYQTAGRGQRGTHWESTRGENLLFGIRCCPTFLRASHQFLLSEVQALAVAEALAQRVGEVCVKWPNDVYVGDKKVCGMLLEHDLCGTNVRASITGVGVNVNQRQFLSDAPNPISLVQLLGHNTNRAALMTDIVQRFEQHYHTLQAGDEAQIHTAYLAMLYRREGIHDFALPTGQRFRASIDTVQPDGTLCLQQEDGSVVRFAFKEVSFVL